MASAVPAAGGQITGSETQSELWLVCPICKQPNPSGTLHCKYCWGASLYSIQPVTKAELAEILRRRLTRQKKLNVLRTILIGFGAPLLLLGAIFFWLYYFTDIIFAPPAQMSSASPPGEWTMFRHDFGRTGSSDISTVSPQGKLKWSFQTGAGIHSSPTVVDGVVYFGSRDYKMYAVDAVTGQKRWEFSTGSWVESSPAVVNGVVYFGSNDGYFYALEAATGHELWKFQTRYVVISSPAVADGLVYFGGDDAYVYALDSGTGALIWKVKTQGAVSSSPVVANGILYIGSTDMSGYAFNAVNGQFRLRLKTFDSMSSPVVSDSTVYFTGRNYIYAIDGEARNWPGEFALRSYWIQMYAFYLAPPPPPISGFLWAMKVDAISNSIPVLDGNTLYTAGNNQLMRSDLTKRQVQWKFDAGSPIFSSPALANNILYAGCDDGRLYAVDAGSGSKLWEFKTDDKITSSPTYVNGVIYLTSEDGALYAIE